MTQLNNGKELDGDQSIKSKIFRQNLLLCEQKRSHSQGI